MEQIEARGTVVLNGTSYFLHGKPFFEVFKDAETYSLQWHSRPDIDAMKTLAPTMHEEAVIKALAGNYRVGLGLLSAVTMHPESKRLTEVKRPYSIDRFKAANFKGNVDRFIEKYMPDAISLLTELMVPDAGDVETDPLVFSFYTDTDNLTVGSVRESGVTLRFGDILPTASLTDLLYATSPVLNKLGRENTAKFLKEIVETHRLRG